MTCGNRLRMAATTGVASVPFHGNRLRMAATTGVASVPFHGNRLRMAATTGVASVPFHVPKRGLVGLERKWYLLLILGITDWGIHLVFPPAHLPMGETVLWNSVVLGGVATGGFGAHLHVPMQIQGFEHGCDVGDIHHHPRVPWGLKRVKLTPFITHTVLSWPAAAHTTGFSGRVGYNHVHCTTHHAFVAYTISLLLLVLFCVNLPPMLFGAKRAI